MASKLLGAHVKRKEDPRLITGVSQYVADIAMPGMQHVAFVRSPHAHARVRGIKHAAAAKLPGVVAVVTGQDLKAHFAPIPVATASAEGGAAGEIKLGRQHYPLSLDRVRYVGEPVAAVIGLSPEAATDAAALVEVDWEPLPAVADPFAAMADGAPQLFDDAPKNIEHTNTIKAGDPDAAFAKAHRVVKQRMNSQRLSGIPMETRAVLAAPDFASGGLTVWATHQAPHVLRGGLADALRMPQNQIRVICPEVGGGFGVKFGTYPGGRDGRRTREAAQGSATVDREPGRAHDRHHPRPRPDDRPGGRGGRGGAHQRPAHARGGRHRRLPDLHVHSRSHPDDGRRRVPREERGAQEHVRVHQHHVGGGLPRRGPARRPPTISSGCVDCIAMELGKPPEEVRRVNFIPPSAFPYAAPTGQNYDSGEYARALAKSLEVSKYTALRAEQRKRIETNDRKLLGIGMACYVEMCGFGPVRERDDPGGAERHGDRLHRRLRARAGARDHVRPAHRRLPGGGLRSGGRAPRRHHRRADGLRHRRQPQPGGRRLGDGEGGREGAGARPPHRGRGSRGRVRGRRGHRRALPRQGLAGQEPDPGQDRGEGLRRGPARRDGAGARGHRVLPPAAARLSLRRARGGGGGGARHRPGHAARVHLGRRLRRARQPAAGGRAGARRHRPGRRPSHCSRKWSTARTASS